MYPKFMLNQKATEGPLQDLIGPDACMDRESIFAVNASKPALINALIELAEERGSNAWRRTTQEPRSSFALIAANLH